MRDFPPSPPRHFKWLRDLQWGKHAYPTGTVPRFSSVGQTCVSYQPHANIYMYIHIKAFDLCAFVFLLALPTSHVSPHIRLLRFLARPSPSSPPLSPHIPSASMAPATASHHAASAIPPTRPASLILCVYSYHMIRVHISAC